VTFQPPKELLLLLFCLLNKYTHLHLRFTTYKVNQYLFLKEAAGIKLHGKHTRGVDSLRNPRKFLLLQLAARLWAHLPPHIMTEQLTTDLNLQPR
jgi:hypothetical protein